MTDKEQLREALNKLVTAAARIDNLHHAGISAGGGNWSRLHNAINHAKAVLGDEEAGVKWATSPRNWREGLDYD